MDADFKINADLRGSYIRVYPRCYPRLSAYIIMFEQKVKLSDYSNFKIGGPARYFFAAKSVDEIIEALNKYRQIQSYETKSRKIFILGEGTNILFDDGGFDGLIIKSNFNFIKKDGNILKIGAGVSITQLLNYSITRGLSGLEWAGGLPGTLGGAICGNAGAFGGEIKDVLREVTVLDISGKKPVIVKKNNNECGFQYRSSMFKKKPGREIILEATLILKPGDKKEIRSLIEEKIKYREERQPLEYPNIGSIFKNIPLTQINADIQQIKTGSIRVNPRRERGSPSWAARGNPRKSASIFPIKTDPFPLVPTAHLISEAGLKGVSFGGAMVSPKHPNFIVNTLNATAEDVKKLIKLVKNKVKKKFNIALQEEVEYVP